MTQAQILEAIKSHLDDLRSVLNWALLLAVPFWWAGLQQSESLTVIGMQVPRGQALSVAAFFYLLTNLAMLDRFLRLRDLLVALDPGTVSEGVSRLFLHPWLFNPFACFGTSAAIRRLHTVTGTGLLIVAWCACDASLYVLSPPVDG